MNLKNSLNALFPLFALLFVSPAHAAWYQVEIIVFDYNSPSFDGELWYENPGLPDRSNSIKLITELADDEELVTQAGSVKNKNQAILQNKAELIPYLQLTEDVLRLDGVQRVLLLSRQYRPLLHLAWQQPGLRSSSARAVHLQKFSEIEALTTAAFPDGPVLPEDLYQVQDLVFDGTIRLRSSKFLHVDVDIAYFPEYLLNEGKADDGDNRLFVEQQADYVRLKESRRIRLNEIHYFDHPVFGVILRVSRLNVN